MNRFAYTQLTDWRKSKVNSVLIIGGVPGVGKRDMVKKFANEAFDNFVIIDLLDNEKSLNNEIDINSTNSLIIFDNILGNKQKLIEIVDLSRKYPNLKFIVIDPFAKESRGSNLSVTVSYLILYPLGFEEFLFNTNRSVFDKLGKLKGVETISQTFHEELINVFIEYLIVGGMPSVVKKYKEQGLLFPIIREEQQVVLDEILNKFSNYYKTTDYKNLKSIINLIFSTLVRDNRKFKLADISLSKRFSSFQRYFKILENLNVVYISKLLKGSPFKTDEKSLVIYLFDTGLLGLLGNVPKEHYTVEGLLSNPILLALCVNFTACELHSTKNTQLNFWNNNMSKVEFLLTNSNHIMPIELKNDESGKLKSLESFQRIYKNEVSTRLNISKPSTKGSVKTYPIYLVKSLYRKFLSLN